MDIPAQPAAKRPKLVWVIFLFYLFSAGYTLLSFLLIFSGALPLNAAQATYFHNLSALAISVAVVISLLNLAGAVMLFRLRKVAPLLFIAAFAITLAQTLQQIVMTNLIAALAASGGVIGLAIGYAISAAVCIYAWKLKTRGALQ